MTSNDTGTGPDSTMTANTRGTMMMLPEATLVTVTAEVTFAREQGSTDAPIRATWMRGRRFWCKGMVIGDAIDGNPVWLVTGKGHRNDLAWRVWSGATDVKGIDMADTSDTGTGPEQDAIERQALAWLEAWAEENDVAYYATYFQPAVEDDNNYYRGECQIDGKDAALFGEAFTQITEFIKRLRERIALPPAPPVTEAIRAAVANATGDDA